MSRILLVEDDPSIGRMLEEELGRSKHEVVWVRDGRTARTTAAGESFDVVLLDLRLPDVPGEVVLREIKGQRDAPEVILLTAHGSIELAVRCLKEGAFDFLEKPCRLDRLEAVIERALRSRSMARENRGYRERFARADGSILDEPLPPYLDDLTVLAKNDLPVLILGPTGAGKEVVARRLHAESPRHDQPFFVVDCSSLKEELIESELFGHERGAFTGADRTRPGLVEMASDGTVFLDEVGELGLDVQGKLLRLLETGEYRRVGGREWRKSTARWFAATHRDLRAAVDEGTFRSDLYYRLNVLRVEVPPLKERRDEIPRLARRFLSAIDRRLGNDERTWSPEVETALADYDWPGNVRELRNVIERMAVLSRTDRLEADALPSELRPTTPDRTSSSRRSEAIDPTRTLAEIEREQILAVLDACEGNKTRAAKQLGISVATLYNKLARYENPD